MKFGVAAAIALGGASPAARAAEAAPNALSPADALAALKSGHERDLVSAGKVKIAAAIHDLETGVVTYLD